MKLGITKMGQRISKKRSVSSRSQSLTAVTASEWRRMNWVTRAMDGSLPTTVMSVPCSVVMNGSRMPSSASISRADQALMPCGMA